ncbi:pre-mRNA-splicing helicase BRR2 [Nematocida sp. AWRm77]|nr:pre-mRNA-splicing helicase BRR2 [Nematocida sp. AWRm77]
MEDRIEEWKRAQKEVHETWRLGKNVEAPRDSVLTETPEYSSIEMLYSVVKRELKEVSSLGDIEKYFPYRHFNKVQSAVAEKIFRNRESVLLSAPTGCGKTDMAVLGILREYIEKKDKARVVYIAPTKALIREVETTLQKRLPFLDCISDTSDSRAENHHKYHILVTTPEKMDILTLRKKVECTLLIVDELHMLGEERGPVLEALIVRAQKRKDVRIIGMGGTMPNYKDLGEFLGAPPENTFYFGAEYREVPIKCQVVGLHKKSKALCAIREAREKSTVVFSTSKEECHALASILGGQRSEEVRKKIFAYLDSFCEGSGVLQAYIETPENRHFYAGVGVHHSGLAPAVRKMVEDLFRAGVLTLLCSTTTLGWGVNLPIDTVIINGTEVFKKDTGKTEYTLKELAQMCGRAGRKGMCAYGKAVVITSYENMHSYTRAPVFQFPVESHMASVFSTRVLYEINAGENTHDKLCAWFKKTFACQRGRKSAATRHIVERPQELISSAVQRLARYKAIEHRFFEEEAGKTLTVSEIGKVSFMHYVDPETVWGFERILNSLQAEEMDIDMGDVLLILSTARELSLCRVCAQDRPALESLKKKIPYPIRTRESKIFCLIESTASVNETVSVLLQAYISNVSLPEVSMEGLLDTVRQSIPRLAHALLSLSLARLNRSVHTILDLNKSLTEGRWKGSSPLALPSISVSIEKEEASFGISVFNMLKKEILITISSSAQYSLIYHSITTKPKTVITFPLKDHHPQRICVDYLREFSFPTIRYF